MMGTMNNVGDVSQGGLGNCYFLSSIAAIAEDESRIAKNIVNDLINNAGLYVFNVFVRGIPRKVHVDDMIPVSSSR